MKGAAKTILFLAAISLCGMGHELYGNSRTEERAARGRQSKEDSQHALEATAKEMLALIKDGQPKELLRLMAKDGVVFGLDPPPISMKDIRRHFQEKTDAYCVLFDTKCLLREINAERKRSGAPEQAGGIYSYRDTLRRAAVKKIEADAGTGFVEVILEETDSTRSGAEQNPLQFEFVLESGRWKLSAIIYH